MPQFLRNLPKSLNTEQRMELDALGYAADLIEIGISRLRQAAQFFTSEDPQIESNILTVRSMFLDAWAIVDNAYNMRKLLERIQKRMNFGGSASQQTLSFLELAQKATILRNGMDHLSEQLPNLAKKKNASALYGALSWVWITEFKEGTPARARINLLTTGAFHREGETMAFANPAGERLEIPFGMFSLHAFETQLDLSELSRRSEAVRDYYNTSVSEEWEQEAERYASISGIDLEKMKETSPGHVWFSLSVDFTNPAG